MRHGPSPPPSPQRCSGPGYSNELLERAHRIGRSTSTTSARPQTPSIAARGGAFGVGLPGGRSGLLPPALNPGPSPRPCQTSAALLPAWGAWSGQRQPRCPGRPDRRPRPENCPPGRVGANRARPGCLLCPPAAPSRAQRKTQSASLARASKPAPRIPTYLPSRIAARRTASWFSGGLLEETAA